MKHHNTNTQPKVVYERSRLTFIPKLIEPLEPEDSFRVVTPQATFQMTKEQFYEDFHHVVESSTYAGDLQSGKKGKRYSYWKAPRKAYKYLISGEGKTEWGPHHPVVVRSVSKKERQTLEEGLTSSQPVVQRRCRILLASLDGQSAKEISQAQNSSINTIARAVHDFNDNGVAALWKHKRPYK